MIPVNAEEFEVQDIGVTQTRVTSAPPPQSVWARLATWLRPGTTSDRLPERLCRDAGIAEQDVLRNKILRAPVIR